MLSSKIQTETVTILIQVHSAKIKPSKKAKLCLEGKRARELFEALDEDGNGSLTEDEFVEGCMTDQAFVQLLQDFNGDFIFDS